MNWLRPLCSPRPPISSWLSGNKRWPAGRERATLWRHNRATRSVALEQKHLNRRRAPQGACALLLGGGKEQARQSAETQPDRDKAILSSIGDHWMRNEWCV